MGLANRYGFLGQQVEHWNFAGRRAAEIADDCGWPAIDPLWVRVEGARQWQRSILVAEQRLRSWADLQAREDAVGMREYLEREFNCHMGQSLTFRLGLDSATHTVQSEVIAASLRHLVDLQWGLAIAGNHQHRQCAECTNWFALHPGRGRSDKRFCSTRCRVRGHRRDEARAVR